MASPLSEPLILVVFLQQTISVLAFPTESAANQDADTALSKQCLLNPMLPQCHTGLTTTAPSAASTSETESQNATAASQGAEFVDTSENEVSSDWSAPSQNESHSLVDVAQRSLSGRFALLVYKAIMRSDILTKIESVARRKRNDWPMLAAGLTIGGTLLTAGLAALAAMSGKALMSSMLALGMSLMAALRSAPARRCRRSVGTGRGDSCGSANYELIARPVVTHTHAHSAALQLEQPYPGYVRSFLDSPADSNSAAAAPASEAAPDTAWINYRIPDTSDSGSNTKTWAFNAAAMKTPFRSANTTTEYTAWGPRPPSTEDMARISTSLSGYASQPRDIPATSTGTGTSTRGSHKKHRTE